MTHQEHSQSESYSSALVTHVRVLRTCTYDICVIGNRRRPQKNSLPCHRSCSAESSGTTGGLHRWILSPDRVADKYLGLGMGMGQERKQAGDSICCRKFLNHLKDDDELMQSARTLYTYILFLPSPPAGSLSPPTFYPPCSYPADSAPPVC